MSFIVRTFPESVLPRFLKFNSKLLVTIFLSIVLLIFNLPEIDAIDFSFFQINLSNNQENAQDPQIVTSGNTVYVVWRNNTLGNDDVSFRKSTDEGTTFGNEINLSQDVQNSILPQIDVSGSNVYVIWQNDTAVIDEILFRKSSDNGNSFSSITQLSDINNNSASPRMVASGSNVYAIWTDFTVNSNGDIIFKSSTNNGSTFSGATINLSSDTSVSTEAKLAAAGTNVHVVWRNDTGNGEILYRRSTDSGQNFDSAINLSSNSGNSIEPEITVSGSNVYVTWRDFTTGNGEILYRRSTDSGQNFDSAINLSSNSGNSLEHQIAVSGSNVYVVWRDDSPGNNDIFYRNSTDNGATFDSITNLSSNSGSSQSPVITSTGANVYVAWRDFLNSNNEILFRGSNDSGSTFSPTRNLSGNSGSSTREQIAASTSKIIVVWDDDTSDPQNDRDILLSVGTVSNIEISFNATEYKLSETAFISITDPNSNNNSGSIETISSSITSTSDSSGISLTLTETGPNTEIFTGTFSFTSGTSSGNNLKASASDTITAAFGGQTGTVNIFSRTVSFEFSQYTLSENAQITVTDQNSNLQTSIIEIIPISVSSTTNPSGISLTLTETGPNTGIFTNTGLIFMTGNDLFQLGDTATVSLDDNTVNLDSNAFETVSMSVTSTSDPTGIPSFILTETGIDTGVFSATLGFTTSSSNSTHIEVAGGDILSVSYLGETSNGLILPNPDPGLGAIRASVGDTITASYLGSSDTTSIGLGSGGGGAGGGLVRPTVVLDFIIGLLRGGGGSDASPPTLSLESFASNKNFYMPDEVRIIVENYDPTVVIPKMNPEYFPGFDFPLTVLYNPYNGYPLGGFENTIETNVVEVGTPVTLTFTFYEQTEIIHFSLYSDLYGSRSNPAESNIQIIFNKDRPLEVFDPYGSIQDESITINELTEDKKQVVVEFTPIKEDTIKDVITRTWDPKLYSMDMIIRNAFEIVPKTNEQILFEDNIPKPEVEQLRSSNIPIWIKNNAAWWSQELIEDSDFVAGIEYLIQNKIIIIQDSKVVKPDSQEIPQWIKNNAAWWSEDLISEQEFIDALEWLVKNKIIVV